MEYTKEEFDRIVENHNHWCDEDCDNWETMKAKLNGAELNDAKLNDAKLNDAKLNGAELNYAKLNGAELNDAKLNGAELNDAKLNGAKLNDAELNGAKLNGAELNDAKLNGAKLNGANMSNANISGATGILSAIDYIANNFEKAADGIIAYKVFNGSYNPPKSWVIKEGSVINENVNSYRTDLCGCGINVATLEWVKKNYPNNGGIWKCLIRWEWLCGVVVPYDTDGKIRCERVELVEIVKQ